MADSDLVKVRKEKREKIKELGFLPYGFAIKDKVEDIKELKSRYSYLKEGQESEDKKEYIVAGRIMAIRGHGKVAFVDIRDTYDKIQLYIKKGKIPENKFKLFKLLEVGDIISAKGYIFRTKKGELSLYVNDLDILTKSIRPLPEKWHGLQDVQLRYRQRYLDLIVNQESRNKFIIRTKIITKLRQLLNDKGFLEVETPMMSLIAGGASAKPFITHHNALDIDLYLRIAPELYLKRLVVGGLNKVYELGRVFRNEGISTKHNPEFTILEIYQAYADYEDMMNLVQYLLSEVVKELYPDFKVKYADKVIDFSPPYKRLTFSDALKEYADIDLKKLIEDTEYRDEVLDKLSLSNLKDEDIAHIIDKVFEEVVEDKLINPTFIIDYPVEISPLAKRKPSQPWLTDRFELYINGYEVANAFTELNEPEDQYERFKKQLEKRQKGDEEAHMMDLDYINALEYGLPPTGGLGFGVDRIVMLLTDSQSIRDVILFPLLKPKVDSIAKK